MIRISLMLSVVMFLAQVASAQTAPTNGKPSAPPHAQNNNYAASAGQALQNTGGSLLKATLSTPVDANQAKLSSVSYFAVPEPEPRTLKKHDLVTIIIREESTVSSDGTSDLKRTGDLDAQVNNWIKINPGNWAIQGGGIGGTNPQITMSGTRNFKGEATVDRNDTFVTRITAEIMDVKPNGTLVLQATKTIKNDDEEQKLILTGTCRAIDISADNTILSTQIHDLDARKTNKGAVRDTTKRGLIGRFLDFINPF